MLVDGRNLVQVIVLGSSSFVPILLAVVSAYIDVLLTFDMSLRCT